MSLETALHLVLGTNPVPGLSAAFTLLKFIVSSIQTLQASRKQLEGLAKAAGQLLATLNSEFKGSRLIVAECKEQLTDLQTLLEDIHRFVDKEQARGFFKSLLKMDSRVASIEVFYRRIGIIVNAFQISGLLSIQTMMGKNEKARNEDTKVLNTQLKNLGQNQVQLRKTLEINQNSMIAMMACIQRRLDGEHLNDPERTFYSHTLQYLTSMSGRQLKLEDWMITSFEVEYGPEIGAGGFGTVYRGTWNRTDVAIKVLQNMAAVTPSLVLLQQEIDIWLTLRHPNVLQFLGANTLDNTPFLVMPYIRTNARQFLQECPGYDPVYILRDVSRGMQYLHSRKICHGDIKGINILVEDSGRSLLCDFGLSRVKADITGRTAQITNNMGGSRNWMAPELLAGALPKIPSDIYAFGMTLYELYTGDNPLSGIAHTDFIELVFRLGIRPERPDHDDVPKLSDPLWTLAEQCWLQDPKARPSTGQIHDLIVDVISQLVENLPEQSAHENGTETERSDDKTNQDPTLFSNPELAKLNLNLLENRLILGDNHPESLKIMAKLVRAYTECGQLKRAEELGLEVFKKQKEVLGEDHPATLWTMGLLADTYSRSAKFKEAEEVGVAAMKKHKLVLGEDHSDTLITIGNLAMTYNNLKQFKEAAELGVVVVEKQKQVLGVDHPRTLRAIANLAESYTELGQLKQAEELGILVMKRRTQLLGDDHPHTLMSMGQLVDIYNLLGKLKEAKKLGVLVMKKQTRVLGEDHATTLLTKSHMVNTYNCLGQLKKAAKLGTFVMEKQKEVLGKDHLENVWIMTELVSVYQKLGRATEVRELSKAIDQILHKV
ncbi:kinase-like domain-containing protein [Mycena galopus ATCC 62051]|nr:kinase-like domain-containing protein [Mycena galopus ATCC 62051]